MTQNTTLTFINVIILFTERINNKANILLNVYMLTTGEGRIQHISKMVRGYRERKLEKNRKTKNANIMKTTDENHCVWYIKNTRALKTYGTVTKNRIFMSSESQKKKKERKTVELKMYLVEYFHMYLKRVKKCQPESAE